MQQNTKISFIDNLVTLAVLRPVAVTMVVIAVTVFGFVSYQRLPVNLMPDISYPTLTIRTEYPGSAPEEVEKNVTEKIEEALAAISNLVSHNSSSRSEISDVVLEFSWDTNMSLIIQEVREKLDRVGLPKEVTRPLILRYDPSLDPIMRIGLYGKATLYKLRDTADLEVKRALETIPGVASVKVKGGLEEEIRIDLLEQKLVSYSIPISLVLQRLREENLNTPCGSIREGERTYLVRTKNEFKTLKEIEDLPIINKNGINILLKEIGAVTRTNKEKEIITRIGSNPSVEIEIYKEADANIVKVCDAIKWKLFGAPEQQEEDLADDKTKRRRNNNSYSSNPNRSKPTSRGGGNRNNRNRNNQNKDENKKDENKKDENKKDENKKDENKKDENKKSKQNKFKDNKYTTWVADDLPSGIKMEILSDQSEFIRHAIQEVINTCITGGILAIIILLLFLKRPMNTLIIAVTIPISIIATFAPLHLSKTSLNIMSLGGLALGIGMLVDNAIVVLESIVRHRNLGKSQKESAIVGTSEVGAAIIASTLTTVAVFFPILYIQGIAGQIFQDQALTVVFSLCASLIMAIVVIPMLASRSMSNDFIDTKWEWKDYFKLRTNEYIKENWKGSSVYFKIFVIFKSILSYPIDIVAKLVLMVIHIILFSVRIALQLLGYGLYLLMWPLVQFSKIFESWGNYYCNLLRFVIAHPIIIFLCCAVLISFAVFGLLFKVGAELVPELHQGEFSVHISLPVGTPLDKTNEVIKKYETFFEKQQQIKQVFSHIGSEKTSTSSDQEGSHTGIITCILNSEKVSALQEDDYLNFLRKSMPSDTKVKSIRFSRPTLFSFKTPIEIEIYGNDLDELKRTAERAMLAIQEIPALYDTKISVERGNPELHIFYNRTYLFKNDLNIANVATLIRNKIQGETVGKFRLPEKEIPIVVSLDSKDRNHMDSLKNMVVSEKDGRTYLREVGNVEEGTGPSEIRHIQQQRVILITANLYGLDLQGASQKINEKLADLNWLPGYKFHMGGQSEEQEIATQSMQFALLLAAFLVYAIMASQFESLFQPFLIMFTLPLAFIGVIFALVLTKIPISIIVLIGVIILCGIAVNNAIVMIDYINQLRQQNKFSLEDAVIEGAKTRLRPILMTTLTTLLGLLPMTGIFSGGGQGIEIRSPLAITVISGLISSTLLTLVVIPVVYTYGEKMRCKIKNIETSK